MALKRKQKGVTLVEVMVVIAVIGIGTSIMLASMGNAKEQKRVETAAREVAAMFREAQSNALSGKQVSLGGVFYSTCAYRISVLTPQPYMLSVTGQRCDNQNWVLSSSKNFSASRVKLSTIIDAPSVLQVIFSVPHGNVTATASPSSVISGNTTGILVKSENDPSVMYSVCINTLSGKIAEIAGKADCSGV